MAEHRLDQNVLKKDVPMVLLKKEFAEDTEQQLRNAAMKDVPIMLRKMDYA